MSKQDWVTEPKRVEKPWGYEVHWALEEDKYCGKILFLKAGESLSLQYHEKKIETQYIHSGHARYRVGKTPDDLETIELVAGDIIHLPAGTIHQPMAIEDTLILEASTTELSDIVRLEDKYGREGTVAP